MTRVIIITVFTIAVTGLLLLTGPRTKEANPGLRTMDYTAIWKGEQSKEVSPASKATKQKQATAFKDKSMATGVDAKPAVSFG